MSFGSRLAAAWRALTTTGKRSDPYAATYGSGGVHGFAGAAVNRLTASLSSWSGSVNADLDNSLPILRARARSLGANNEHGRRFLSMVANNVVGRRNPKLQVRATLAAADAKGRPVLDKSANDAIEIHWERWGRTADITGRHRSLYAMLRTLVKGVARDGEALVRVIRDRRVPYGLRLQLLEPDRLDESINLRLDNGGVVRQGVEVDTSGRPVAYWVRTQHPGENYAVGSKDIERIPAADLYHVFLPDRAEQVRGVTWLHAVIVRASTLHAYEEAAVVAAHIGAAKIAALERAEDAPDMVNAMADGQSAGIPQIKVEAGELFELPPGYKLNSWNPEYPQANFEPFLKTCLRGLAAGLDVAAHNLTGDMTDVNYSSARIAELGERDVWMALQDWLIESFLQPLYEEWLGLALLHGAIRFPESGKALPAEKLDKFANASRFQGRRWPWVDPQKEAESNKLQLENKLASRTRLAAEAGEEFDDILDELAQEEVAIKDAKLAPEPAPAPKPEPAAKPDPNLSKAVSLLVASAAERREAPDNGTRELVSAVAGLLAAVVARDNSQAPQIHNHVTLQEIQQAINVEPTPITVEPAQVRVDVAPAEVRVDLEANLPPPAVTVNLPSRKTDTLFEHDADGNVIRATQVETDA